MRTTKNTKIEVLNPNHSEGVVDVDTIPSPVIEPLSPIIIEEKEHQNPTIK
jgi:hypothetical protein